MTCEALYAYVVHACWESVTSKLWSEMMPLSSSKICVQSLQTSPCWGDKHVEELNTFYCDNSEMFHTGSIRRQDILLGFHISAPFFSFSFYWVQRVRQVQSIVNVPAWAQIFLSLDVKWILNGSKLLADQTFLQQLKSFLMIDFFFCDYCLTKTTPVNVKQ